MSALKKVKRGFIKRAQACKSPRQLTAFDERAIIWLTGVVDKLIGPFRLPKLALIPEVTSENKDGRCRDGNV